MKRLNIKLALWLLGIAVISVVGVHFLHGYQLDKNADFLRLQAEQAMKDDNPREAIKNYNQYLRYRDDPDAYSALSKLVVEVAKDPDATRLDRSKAYMILEEAIRRHPDLHEVRRRLIDYTMGMRRFPESIEHIQYLFDHGETGSDLDLKIAICNVANGEEDKARKKLCAMIGYNEETNTFADTPPSGAHELPAYDFLTQLMRRRPNGGERSDTIMQQLVTWNPHSAKAHLQRGAYLVNQSQQEIAVAATKEQGEKHFQQARVELDRAIELDAKDVDVMIALAVLAMTERNYPVAQEWLDKGQQTSPERQDVYLRLAQLEMLQGAPQKAADHLQRGLENAKDKNTLLERIVELQFQLNDLAGVRKTREQMAKLATFPPELLRYIDAHLKYSEGDFFAAARDLEAVRPAMARLSNSPYGQQVDVMLNRCYEMLGLPDKQLEVCQRLLVATPGHLSARLGTAIALQNLGRFGEANESVAALAPAAKQVPSLRGPLLSLLITAELQKPSAERDWSDIDDLVELIYEDKTRQASDNAMLKAELLLHKEQFDEAEKLLTATCKEYPKETRAWISLSRCLGRNGKEDKIAQLLAVAEKKAGDSPTLRLEQARVIAREGGEGAVDKLVQLERKPSQFSEGEKTSLMMQYGSLYGSLQSHTNTKRCWKYLAEKEPRNFAVRRLLLELALDNKDEAGLREIRDEVRNSEYFGPQSAAYRFVDASLKLWRVNARRGDKGGPLTDQDRKELAEAMKEVDEALESRKQWYVLWRVRGEIEQLQGADPSLSQQDKMARIDGAVKSLQKSLDLSRSNQMTTARRLVLLLHARNRIAEAAEALKYLPADESPGDKLNSVIADIRLKQGDSEAAIEIAKKDADSNPKNGAMQVWLGQLLDRAGRSEEAEAAYRNATVAEPTLPQAWDFLVRRLSVDQKKADAVKAAEDGAKALDKNTPMQARLFEVAGERDRAEELYKAYIAEKPQDLIALRLLVDFYFNARQGNKAAPQLDEIITIASKSTDDNAKFHLAAARRLKAEILASGRDYQDILAARTLIEQNAKEGVLAPEDMQALVALLVGRPEPESRSKAVQMLEATQTQRALLPREQMLLAQLYDRGEKWPQARDLMRSAIIQKGTDAEVQYAFVQMLMQHNEFDEAAPLVDRLEEYLDPKSKQVINDAMKAQIRVLRARLFAKNDQKDKAVAVLETLIPPRPIPPNQLRILEDLAKTMEELGLLDGAEKLLDEYVSQAPGPGSVALAGFVGRRDDVERCFKLLEQARSSEPTTTILPIALDTIRRLPSEASKERFQLLEQWGKNALETETKQIPQIKMLLAEIYDAQGRYPETIQEYREVLALPETNRFQRAVTLNNLAFLLAIVKDNQGNPAESVKLANEAMQIMGPTSDLLDTRALGYLAQGNVNKALTDLRAAAADSPSNSKLFHLAYAEKQAKNLNAARQAFTKAQEAGIEAAWLTPVERSLYTQLAQDLK